LRAPQPHLEKEEKETEKIKKQNKGEEFREEESIEKEIKDRKFNKVE
jgi:hypothetical protein